MDAHVYTWCKHTIAQRNGLLSSFSNVFWICHKILCLERALYALFQFVAVSHHFSVARARKMKFFSVSACTIAVDIESEKLRLRRWLQLAEMGKETLSSWKCVKKNCTLIYSERCFFTCVHRHHLVPLNISILNNYHNMLCFVFHLQALWTRQLVAPLWLIHLPWQIFICQLLSNQFQSMI